MIFTDDKWRLYESNLRIYLDSCAVDPLNKIGER